MNDQEPAPPKAEPSADHGLRAVLAVVAFVFAASTWLAAFFFVMVFVPKYEEIFRDFGVALPHHTRAVIAASMWLDGMNPGQRIGGSLICVPVVLAAFAGVGCLALSRRTRLAAIVLLTLMTFAAAATLVASYVSVQLPMTAMQESLQGGKL